MGNATSAEAPRKPPHRLSKLRVESQALTVDPRDSGGACASSSARYSSSYLAASLPRNPALLSVSKTNPTRFPERHQQPSRRLSRQELERARSIPVPEPPQSDLLNETPYSLYADSNAGDKISRLNSIVLSSAKQPLARTQSWHGYRQEKCKSLQSELHWYGSKRLPGPSSEHLQGLQAATVENQLEMQQLMQTASLSSQSNQLSSTTLTRTTSDLSSYAPVRRRSVIQTPGVATRLQREDLPFIPDRSSRRRSHLPPMPDQPNFISNAKAPKYLSIPPRPVGFDSQEPSVTPSEAEYKQLGGIKFGSLRITNGSPTPIHTSKNGQRQPLRSGTQSRTPSYKENKIKEHYNGDTMIAKPRLYTNVKNTVITTSAEASTSDYNACNVAKPDEVPSPKLAFLDNSMPSPFCNDLSALRFNIQLAPTTTTRGDGYAPETTCSGFFDVGQAPDYKFPIGDGQLDPCSRSFTGMTRSDSGFCSTSSSGTSRQTLSKADSGYSSNISVHSFPNSSQIRMGSDQSIQLDTDNQRRESNIPQRTLRTLKKPPSAASVDENHKHGKLHGLFIKTDRKSVASDRAIQEASDATPTVSNMDTKHHDPYNRLTAASHQLPHNVEPNSVTLNTILGVESLLPPTDALTGDDNDKAEPGMASQSFQSVKTRGSLWTVADFAQAATSRMPSLKLHHRKSITGKPARLDKRFSNEDEAVEAKTNQPENRRDTALERIQQSSDNNESYSILATPVSYRGLRSRSSTVMTLTKPPTEPNQTPLFSKARALSIRTQASVPNLRLSTPGQLPPSSTTSVCSPQIKLGIPSPKAQRSRGVMDPGIPPPIPPQFRTPEFLAAQPPSLSQKKNNRECRMSCCSPRQPMTQFRDRQMHASDPQ